MRRLLLLIAAACAALSAEEGARPAVVRAAGEAMVSVRPDQARLRLAVVTTADSPERAREKNAERATSVIAELRKLLGADANIRTANYSLDRNHGDEYVANNMIEVRVPDPTLAGRIIDVATRLGVTVSGGPGSSALEEQEARAEALKEAAVRAKANAEAITSALGLRVVRVLSAETSGLPVARTSLPDSSPQASVRYKKKVSAATPIAVGGIDVRAQVIVTVEVAGR